MKILNFLVLKSAQTLTILFLVLAVLFFIFHVAGGDPTLSLAGKNTDQKSLQMLRSELGLDKSILEQFVQFLQKASVLDWGQSWTSQQPVLQMIQEGVAATAFMIALSYTSTFIVGYLLAVFSIQFRGTVWDSLLHLVASLLMSVSFIVVVIFLQQMLAYRLNWFPVYGWERGSQGLRYFILPCLIFVVGHFAPRFLQLRALISGEIQKNYVRTALAKGVGWRKIYCSHILLNIAPTLSSFFFAQLPVVFTGTLLLEVFFGIPGLGQLMVNSIQANDFPVIKAVTVMGSCLYIFFLLISDVCAYFFIVNKEPI